MEDLNGRCEGLDAWEGKGARDWCVLEWRRCQVWRQWGSGENENEGSLVGWLAFSGPVLNKAGMQRTSRGQWLGGMLI